METERKPNEKPPMKGGFSFGGAYWTRTSDPIDVNDVLYQLSQSTGNEMYYSTAWADCQPLILHFLFLVRKKAVDFSVLT